MNKIPPHMVELPPPTGTCYLSSERSEFNALSFSEKYMTDVGIKCDHTSESAPQVCCAKYSLPLPNPSITVQNNPVDSNQAKFAYHRHNLLEASTQLRSYLRGQQLVAYHGIGPYIPTETFAQCTAIEKPTCTSPPCFLNTPGLLSFSKEHPDMTQSACLDQCKHDAKCQAYQWLPNKTSSQDPLPRETFVCCQSSGRPPIQPPPCDHPSHLQSQTVCTATPGCQWKEGTCSSIPWSNTYKMVPQSQCSNQRDGARDLKVVDKTHCPLDTHSGKHFRD